MKVSLQKSLSEFVPEERDYVSENLQYRCFKNIDYALYSKPISFYRSDFRGTRFENICFFKNNFSRADFIDSTFLDCRFENCKFGPTGLHNSTFIRVVFKKNSHDSSFFTGNTFIDCKFEEETLLRSLIENCSYSNCALSKYNISESTAVDLQFIKCSLDGEDFSNMYASYFSFSACNVVNFTLDADYLGTFLFKSSRIQNLRFKYRGKIVRLGGDGRFIEELLDIYYSGGRYLEYFNFRTLARSLGIGEPFDEKRFKDLIESILADNERSFEQLHRICKSILFFLDSGVFELKEVSLFIKIIISCLKCETDSLKRLRIEAEINCIIAEISVGRLPVTSTGFHEQTAIVVRFKYITQKTGDALREVDFLLKAAGRGLTSRQGCYAMQRIRKGSVVVEIVIYSGLVASLLKMLCNTYVKVKINYKLSVKIEKMIESAESTEELAKVSEIIDSRNQILAKEMKNIIGVLKSVTIYPNARE